MNEEVAGDSGSVIAIAAPAEQPLRLEGHFGGAAEEAVPIDIFGRGVGRYGIFPSPDSVIAIPPGFHHVGLADGAGLHQLLGFLVDDGADALAADLDDASGFLFRFDERLAVLDMLDHGLFAVHILARVHGVDGDFLVPMIGCGYDDCVDIRTRQDFAVIARDEDILAVDFLHPREAALIDIAGGYQFGTGSDGRSDVFRAHAARADDGDLDGVVGGARFDLSQ